MGFFQEKITSISSKWENKDLLSLSPEESSAVLLDARADIITLLQIIDSIRSRVEEIRDLSSPPKTQELLQILQRTIIILER